MNINNSGVLMSSFINYGVERVLREIPEEILHRAFGSNEWHNHLNRLSLEERIRREVLVRTVLPDCNIVGGEMMEIALGNFTWEWLDNGARVEIPMSATRNRKISSVLSIETSYRNTEAYGAFPGEPTPTGHCEVYLVGPNVIYMPIHPGNMNCFLRCVIENDGQMANISPRAMYVFGDLAVLAAKAYVFNKLAVNSTIVSMSGGQVDGRMRGIIDGYADATTMYSELLTVRWKKIALLNDRKWHHRLIGIGLHN